MDKPLVSIVTPSYNQAQFLEETILSVLNQDYPNIEYIVIDGGSTDGSVDILRKYESRLAFWVSEPDRGQSHAINKGWRCATGDIVAYLNSDDLYTPGAVTAGVHAFAAHPDAGMVYSDALFVDAEGISLGKRRAHPFNLQRLITTEEILPQPTVFIQKWALDAVGLLGEGLYMSMDYDLLIRLGLRYPAVYLPHACLAVMRQHAAAKSTASVDKFAADRRRVIQKLYAENDLPKSINAFRGTAFASTWFQEAAVAGRAGQTAKILRPLLRAIIESPTYVARRPFTLYLLARILMPWWTGKLSPAASSFVDRATEFVQHASMR